MNMQAIKNVSDAVPLYLPHSLYLKPHAKINISASLPQTVPGKTISNWDVMEKIRFMIQPDQFSVLKVSKSTLDFLRFDAELESADKIKSVLARLDGRSFKLASFSDPIKLRSSMAKDEFPTRHDWDSFFRDTRDMDEMKAGERPDTIHISNLPIRWFCARHLENEDVVKPSESIFKRIFEKFGDVRSVDIPICDPYRKDMKSHMTGMKTFSFDQELYFEGYVQFNEYLGFVKTMDEFRGMKLLRKEEDKNLAVNIAVDFDRSKHLSDASIKRRRIIRERFMAKEVAKEEEEKKKMQAEEERIERERRRQEELRMAELDQQRERENKRKEKQLQKLRDKEQHEMSHKIRSEEKKLMIAQRKLESIRLLEALYDRIKLNAPQKVKIKSEHDSKQSKTAGRVESSNGVSKIDLRNKLMNRFKASQEQELERQKNRLKKVKTSGILGSALKGSGGHDRSPSVNSISSDDSILSDSRQKKKKKKKKRGGSDSEATDTSEPENNGVAPMMPATAAPFPMFNPESGQWMHMNMGMGMGMYPFPPFFPTMPRPEYYPNPMAYRGYRGVRGTRYPRARGRGQGARGRGGYQSYDGDYNKYENYENDHYDQRRSKYSRSSRSHSRGRRSRTRSRSRSRSYSRSRSSRSRSRSRSKSKSKTKLVSTLRKSRSSTRWSSRSNSRSRSNTKRRAWSSHDKSSRSRSRSRSRTRSFKGRSKGRKHRSSSRRDASAGKAVVLEPEKLVKTAKEIQRQVQQKLFERHAKDEKEQARSKSPSVEKVKHTKNSTDRSPSPKRSTSVDSSKFLSPKHKARSTTPEKVWNKDTPIFDAA